MLLQVKSSISLSCLFFTSIIRRKNRVVETYRTSVMNPLYSHEFESHGRHSYKVFPHLNFGVVFFHVLLIIFCVLFVCFFVLIFVLFFFL